MSGCGDSGRKVMRASMHGEVADTRNEEKGSVYIQVKCIETVGCLLWQACDKHHFVAQTVHFIQQHHKQSLLPPAWS